ncbi:MAG TPA: T9SS type A sorting domain-containing protein, partial [Caldithrix abyssi]|nr:T9SS type A sorting domain-containing protein [Caldithrix abyssi]
PQSPALFSLEQNYPNPFNPETVIRYQLPEAGPVQLSVYNALGQKVQELVNEKQEAGNYTVKFNGQTLASGVYLYKLQTGNNVLTRKMILLR